MNKAVRARFAPSPTGHLHIGSLRTALFNWLFARSVGGTFLVRIEDTDIERSLPIYVDSIIKALQWVGLSADEEIVFQTQRMHVYADAVNKLLESGKAYRCFCPQGDQAVQGAEDMFYKYDRRCRTRVATSQDHELPHVIRFALPLDVQQFGFTDIIRGPITFDANQFDDFIIVRSDGMPLYNFVVVVDDIAMHISHIIRGEDHIGNTPKQIALYEALGAQVPLFAHLPLILGSSGQRLSKRDAATSVWEYKSMGYLPDALCNYLMRLGWSYKDYEILTKQEGAQLFTFDGVGKSGAIFDSAKLDWINSTYMKAMSNSDLYMYIVKEIDQTFEQLAHTHGREFVESLIGLYKERVSTITLLAQHVRTVADATYAEKIDTTTIDRQTLSIVNTALIDFESWEPGSLKKKIEQVCNDHAIKFSAVAQPLRYALSGAPQGPGVAELLAILGKKEALARIARYV